MAWVRSESEDHAAHTAPGTLVHEAGEPIRERPLVEPLAARIADPDVLREAWTHVHRAGGAPGIDGVDLATFGRELDASR